jgi:hypothetical protein
LQLLPGEGLHVDGLQRGLIRGQRRCSREHAEYSCEHEGRAEETIHQAMALHS